MKKLIITAVLLVSGAMFSQNITRVLEEDGDKVKATYYAENGKIQQEGYFKDGLLHGKWVSFDANGNKISSGQYKNGVKVGKWEFYSNGSLKEVEYSDSRVASVKTWQKDALANRN